MLWAMPFVPGIALGNPINVNLKAGLSNPIYLNAGPVTINLSALLRYGGRDNPAEQQSAASVLIYNTSGEKLATVPIFNWGQAVDGLAPMYGTVTWNNPVAQYIELSGEIYIMGYGDNFLEWWYLPEGRSAAFGGDTPNAPPVVSVTPTPRQQTGSNPPPRPSSARSNIHAVIISGLSDPAKVISSTNVTVTGGIVALGKNDSPPAVPSAWSPGLEIIPDYALLTGQKIPPVTPNIIDLRIVRQEVTADFPSPNP